MVWRTGGDFNFISFHFPFLFSHEMETQLKKKKRRKENKHKSRKSSIWVLTKQDDIFNYLLFAERLPSSIIDRGRNNTI